MKKFFVTILLVGFMLTNVAYAAVEIDRGKLI